MGFPVVPPKRPPLPEGTPPLPVVLLTGFLGAGKTTILNRVLGAQHRRRMGVIVNELGRIDVDGKLLKARSGDVVELVGGCVCHEVQTQEELLDAILEMRSRANLELVVLETTGIAEPEPIVSGLESLPASSRPAEVAGVVTVVDAESGLAQLERHVEAHAQVVEADRILLTKLDLAAPADVVALHARLATLNPEAERASFPPTPAGTAELWPWLLDVDGMRAERTGRTRPARRAHDHHHQLVAASHTDEVPLLAEPLLAVLEELGPALVRVKGWVHIAGERRRGFLERAGAHTTLAFDDVPASRTELVFIGEGLDASALRRRLWACRSASTTSPPP